MVVPHIVYNYDDLRMLSVDVKDFFQVFFKASIVPLLVEGDCYLACIEVVAAHSGLSFTSLLLGHDLRLATDLAPFIANRGSIRQRKFILIQQNSIRWTFQNFFLNRL